VDVHDPWVDAAEARHEYGIEPVTSRARSPAAYDAVVLAVAHRQFKAELRRHSADPRVLFDVKHWGGPDRHVIYDIKERAVCLRMPWTRGSDPLLDRTGMAPSCLPSASASSAWCTSPRRRACATRWRTRTPTSTATSSGFVNVLEAAGTTMSSTWSTPPAAQCLRRTNADLPFSEHHNVDHPLSACTRRPRRPTS
jgi:hypothetical protein